MAAHNGRAAAAAPPADAFERTVRAVAAQLGFGTSAARTLTHARRWLARLGSNADDHCALVQEVAERVSEKTTQVRDPAAYFRQALENAVRDEEKRRRAVEDVLGWVRGRFASCDERLGVLLGQGRVRHRRGDGALLLYAPDDESYQWATHQLRCHLQTLLEALGSSLVVVPPPQPQRRPAADGDGGDLSSHLSSVLSRARTPQEVEEAQRAAAAAYQRGQLSTQAYQNLERCAETAQGRLEALALHEEHPDWGQAHLAAVLDVSQSTVSRWLRQAVSPRR